MTKSRMTAVRRRRTNQRIAREYDQVQQHETRAYQERQRVRDPERKVSRQWLAEMGKRIVRNFTRWVSRFLSGSHKKLKRLDLRSNDAERFGAFAPDRRRSVGAEYLRSIFGRYLKMISTRDGRPV